uniref:peptidylprolyl isomerase n=1 Tax=Brassica oleracea var. oleracea TaxID=109376 RepID=A0A0D3B7P1_BRAOL
MIVAGFFESKKNHGNELIEKLEAGMQDMLQIVEDRKRDVVAPKLKENLQYVGGIEEDMVEGFLYEVPEEYINMHFLKRTDEFVVQTRDPDSHAEGFIDPTTEKYWVCTMGMAREGFENDSESSQVFWLLKERELTPSNSNILDGRTMSSAATLLKIKIFWLILKSIMSLRSFKLSPVEKEYVLAQKKTEKQHDIILRDPTTFETFFLIIMASTSTILAALKYGRCSSTVEVEVRLLRFWEARNIKRGGHFMGVDMLLLDSKAMLIPATINVNRLPTYRGHLKGTVIRAANPAQTSSSEDSSQELSSPEDSTESQDLPSTSLTSENNLEKAESATKALAVADSKVFEAKEASQVADTAPKKSLTDIWFKLKVIICAWLINCNEGYKVHQIFEWHIEFRWMLHVGRGTR